jgi:cytochrome c oxidase subunit 1
MALRRQIRVGSQWMYADEAHKALREALRVMEDEKLAEAHAGHHLPWIRRYVFSTDHKWIGIQYGVTALVFLLLGFCLMILMRLQLGWPGQAFNVMKVLGEGRAPGGVLLPEAYNQLGAMHGTIMIFLGIVPLAVGAFGNYLVPLQIGAPDMAFPKLNMASYWCYAPGGLIMLASFFAPGGTANSGWTSYPPLSVIATQGQT